MIFTKDFSIFGNTHQKISNKKPQIEQNNMVYLQIGKADSYLFDMCNAYQ